MHQQTVKKAALLELPGIAKASGAFIKRQDFIYIGSEFCQNIFPVKKDVAALFDKGAKKIVILTSFMVQDGLSRLQDAVSDILGEFGNIEIMVNDFGFLAYLNKFHSATPKGIGRPLSIDFMRMEHAARAKFFKEHKLGRLETDEADMLHNIPPRPGFKISLHYPLKYAAMSRSCPFVRKITLACAHACYGRTMILPVPGSARPLVARNNAYFLAYRPGAVKNVDRLVKHSFDAGKMNC